MLLCDLTGLASTDLERPTDAGRELATGMRVGPPYELDIGCRHVHLAHRIGDAAAHPQVVIAQEAIVLKQALRCVDLAWLWKRRVRRSQPEAAVYVLGGERSDRRAPGSRLPAPRPDNARVLCASCKSSI